MAKDLGTKTPRESYKDLLHLGNDNNGLTGSDNLVRDGDGIISSITVGKNVFNIQPSTTDGQLCTIKDAGGATLFRIDSNTNSVRATSNLHHVTTLTHSYHTTNLDVSATGHYPLSITGAQSEFEMTEFGSGTDPATTLDFSAVGEADKNMLVHGYWWALQNLQIDSVRVLVHSDHPSDDTCEFHLMRYDISSSTGTEGDLSNGTALAYSNSAVTVNSSKLMNQELTLIATPTATEGQVLLGFIKINSTNGDFSVNMSVKYHLI